MPAKADRVLRLARHAVLVQVAAARHARVHRRDKVIWKLNWLAAILPDRQILLDEMTAAALPSAS